MSFLKQHKSTVQGWSLLAILAAPFGAYLAAQHAWNPAMYAMLGVLCLGMAAILFSD
ncbi:MAG: hypothetical protein KQH53_04355 [Desulfarculaceae bacterium]|nr:hypothetical protein [Desulfarculaceae bacterium]